MFSSFPDVELFYYHEVLSTLVVNKLWEGWFAIGLPSHPLIPILSLTLLDAVLTVATAPNVFNAADSVDRSSHIGLGDAMSMARIMGPIVSSSFWAVCSCSRVNSGVIVISSVSVSIDYGQ